MGSTPRASEGLNPQPQPSPEASHMAPARAGAWAGQQRGGHWGLRKQRESGDTDRGYPALFEPLSSIRKTRKPEALALNCSWFLS